jgi:alpha-N-arabinofuranosidase
VKFALATTICLLASAITTRAAEPSDSAPTTYQNPILPGFYPDPSVCRAGDDYYLVNSSFEYFPGVPIFHSRDLVHWRQIGHVLTRESQLPLKRARASAGVYAPTIRYHDGTFYMVTTNVSGVGNFYCTATDPAGPWSEMIRLDREGIDPSLFFDDDDTAYYIRHVGGGDGYIGLQQLDVKAGKLVGEMKEIWRGTGGVWPEGPHLYKQDGKYFVMIAEGGTSYEHAVTIARSDSPWGPYEACPHNPLLTHRGQRDRPLQALGHADLVETPAGWWAVCLGIRPQGGAFHHLGRETMLAPVQWGDDGWPTMGKDGRLDVEMPAPALPSHAWPETPSRDEFDGEKLDFAWNFLRNPHDEDWSLTARPGFLRLNGSAVTMSDQDSPAFIGRRQPGLGGFVRAKLEFDPQHENEEAGLVIRGNDANHVDFGVTLHDGKRQVFLRRVVKGETSPGFIYAEAPSGPVILDIGFDAQRFGFVAKSAETNRPLYEKFPNVETRRLATETIGGFTGVYLGMYATGSGQRSTTPADFDWFELKITDR